MKNAKKWVSILLVVLMLTASAPLGGLVEIDRTVFYNVADAAETTEDGFTYTLKDDQTTITGYTGSANDLTIPSQLGGYPVTSIGNYAFSYCNSLTSITIPDSVITIGGWAFSCCRSLTSITIPDSVTSIGFYAFSGCDSLISITVDANNAFYSSDEYGVFFTKDKTTLIQYPIGDTRTSYTIPDSVTSIGDYAFSNCDSLTSITIPDSVTRIGFWAFDHCYSLTSITIPDSVASIGDSAFNYCRSLTSITVDANNAFYSSDEYGVLFTKDKATLIQYPVGNTRTSYSIPDGVTRIGERAFYNCDSLTNTTIPDSVTSIGYDAFCGCNSLTSITIPDSVTSIGVSAFSGCFSLASITIGNGVTNIGTFAFFECSSLTSITIPDSVTSIGIGTFNFCDSLKSITVDVNNAFYSSDECGVLFIKDKTTLIRYPAGNSRTSYTIPDSVTSIGDYAFSNCDSLTNITIPDSVTSIGIEAFYNSRVLYTSIFILNPNCVIDDGRNTIPAKTIIHGYADSTAEDFAAKYGNTFHVLTGGDTVDATCTQAGAEGGIYCSSCAKFIIEQKEIPALGHTEEIIPAVAATCTETGLTEGKKCTVCGEILVKQTVVPVLGHTEEIIPAVAATCTKTGLTEGKKCSVCGEILVKQTETPALGHSEEIIPAVAATCAKTGLTEGKKCSVCGEVLVAQKEVPALGHAYDAGTVTKAPTCTEKGVKTFVCANDAKHTYTEEIDKLPHTKVLINEKESTETKDGYTGDLVCADCGTVLERGSIIPNKNGCTHLCHKNGIYGFFWKIMRLFWKLFKINPVCECGAAHY